MDGLWLRGFVCVGARRVGRAFDVLCVGGRRGPGRRDGDAAGGPVADPAASGRIRGACAMADAAVGAAEARASPQACAATAPSGERLAGGGAVAGMDAAA